MPRVSAAYRHSQREAILDAAEACFARRGVAATRMEDVVAESGLSVGAIYRYFASRQQLLLAAHERHRRRDRAAMVLLHDRSLPVRARILASLRYFLARPADQIELESIAGRVSGDTGHEQWIELLSASYAEAQASGLVRNDISPDDVARQVLLTCEGLAVLSVFDALGDADALLESIAKVLADGLAPGAPRFQSPVRSLTGAAPRP
jgi:AcrR family transcriptional regulator